MSERRVLAKRRGDEDASGVVLIDTGNRAQVLDEASRLLTLLLAEPVPPAAIDLLPYFPKESDVIRLGR
jgi:hypothetical protein